ncbi:hypothetical protein D3C72_1541140 [compost metagenome]
MQELVQPIALGAALQGERIGALEFFDARQLVLHVLQVTRVDLGGHRPVLVFQQQGGDAGHRRQVVVLMQVLHRGRQGAAHDQPGDHLRAFHAAQGGVLGVGHFGQAHRVVDQQIDELLVPLRIVETTTLAMHLVGHAAGGDNRHLEVFGVALDGAAQCLAQFVAAPCRGDRQLQYADLQRHDLYGPAFIAGQ